MWTNDVVSFEQLSQDLLCKQQCQHQQDQHHKQYFHLVGGHNKLYSMATYFA